MNTGSIFHYQSAKQFLLDYVENKKSTEKRFSIRRWAKEMQLPTHTLLVMILQGKRSLTQKQVPYLSRGLNLSAPERLYFQALIQFENAHSEEEKDLCRLWLADLNPGGDYRVREIDEYAVIAHWVHMAILALSDCKTFSGTAEEVVQRLGPRVTIDEARSAIERLKSLGLLHEVEGQWRCTYARVTTRDDIANRGAREYHKQVAKLASEIVDACPIDRREFHSFALAIPDSKITLAKEMIRKFRTQLSDAMNAEPGDSVFQMNLHFFQLTESPSKMVSKVDQGAGTAKKQYAANTASVRNEL